MLHLMDDLLGFLLLTLSLAPFCVVATLEPPRKHAQLLRRASSSEEGDGYFQGQVCFEPPCCAPIDCVFPFSHGGKTYENCTTAGLAGFWCGKESTMRQDSRWDYCMPMPKSGSCPDSDGSVLEEKRSRDPDSTIADSAERPSHCHDKPFDEKTAKENEGARSCQELAIMDKLFCDVQPEFAKTQCPDTCGICNEVSMKEACSAPIGIEGASAPSCKEGNFIDPNNWCTPRCQPGQTAWIDTAGYAPNWGCFKADDSRSGLWGYKLCCNMGDLFPDHFSCYRDIFAAMDVDENGVISREEYTTFATVEAPLMAKENAEAEENLTREIEEKGNTINGAASEKKVEKQVEKKENNEGVEGGEKEEEEENVDEQSTEEEEKVEKEAGFHKEPEDDYVDKFVMVAAALLVVTALSASVYECLCHGHGKKQGEPLKGEDAEEEEEEHAKKEGEDLEDGQDKKDEKGETIEGDWELLHDPASGKPYYVNRATGETAWTPPGGTREAAKEEIGPEGEEKEGEAAPEDEGAEEELRDGQQS